MIKVQLADCHDTCLSVEGPGDHVATVNPIGYLYPTRWRVDCDTCMTCVRSGLDTKAEALKEAILHVSFSSEAYFEEWLTRRSEYHN